MQHSSPYAVIFLAEGKQQSQAENKVPGAQRRRASGKSVMSGNTSVALFENPLNSGVQLIFYGKRSVWQATGQILETHWT